MSNKNLYGWDYNHQNTVFSILENITEGDIENELSFLKKLVKRIVLNEKFNIMGGRIWKLMPENKTYQLQNQFGSVHQIPDLYEVKLSSDRKFSQLTETQTMISEEEDPVLLEKGIMLYSMAGAGDYTKIDGKKYYSYILSFNAPEIYPEFYETLSIISAVASIKLHEYNNTQKQKRLQKDLFYAATVQRDLLPEHYIEFYDYKVFGACIQSGGEGNVGGDYFDYFKNSSDEEERLGVLIADAASKGIAAAMQSVFVAGAVKIAQTFYPKISTLVSRTNTLLFEAFPFERPVSMFYCELTLSSNRLVLYANAGHISPIHYRSSTDSFQFLDPTGGVMGILKHQRYTVENVRMLPGDVMVLFTDGITEAMNDSGEVFGYEKLKKIIKEKHYLSIKELAYYIIEQVEKFASENYYNDDKTVIVIKRDIEI